MHEIQVRRIEVNNELFTAQLRESFYCLAPHVCGLWSIFIDTIIVVTVIGCVWYRTRKFKRFANRRVFIVCSSTCDNRHGFIVLKVSKVAARPSRRFYGFASRVESRANGEEWLIVLINCPIEWLCRLRFFVEFFNSLLLFVIKKVENSKWEFRVTSCESPVVRRRWQIISTTTTKRQNQQKLMRIPPGGSKVNGSNLSLSVSHEKCN